MVGLQGLHSSDPLDTPMSPPVWGLNHFAPGVSSWGDTKMIDTHLREVHYRLAIMCDLCKSFASMSALSISDHHLVCKVKHINDCAKQEEHEKTKKFYKKMSKS